VSREKDDGSRSKICPNCAESVPAAAQVCRYCGHSFRGRFARLPRLAVWLAATLLVASIGSAVSLIGPRVYDHFFKSTTQTTVRIMRPATYDALSEHIKVVARDAVECQTSNVDLGNPQAHRCFGSKYIYDPCFEYTGQQLVCLSSPWSKRAALVRVKNEVMGPFDKQLTRGKPWAIELTNGAQCTFVSGATSSVAGLRENYFCGSIRPILVPDLVLISAD
jgi:hypothetical protein